ncbi:serologically defined colon cancer antigen 8 homolog [Copidosoma floridanum]|uniref:serologically defined colon cancer antigen 8 homolog n=1 Tax=Copidosoma floridanum TaxID=29053 RepID=UPI0006C96E28|nr:serologically defined colon cancer antigen 8 homolog [Copidosoma floridanum]
MKTRKTSSAYKMDAMRKKYPNHTELAYREAVSKLKYFLAESYAPSSRTIISTLQPLYTGKRPYRSDTNAEEYNDEDADVQSLASEASKRDPPSKYLHGPRLGGIIPAAPNDKSLQAAAPPPTELLSFIERQEEYIEQLERESQYCKDELKGLLEKVKEVVAENAALQDKYKSGLMKTVLMDDWPEQPVVEGAERSAAVARKTVSKPLEGPSIVFESRIAELEAQLTQARLELRKAREESQASIERLAELRQDSHQPQQQLAELERASRERRDLETRLEELQRELGKSRSRDAEVESRNKRAAELAQQAEYEKAQAEAEVRRLREELERRQDKLRETLQETNRRIAEEKQQVERRFSQQMEQLSADLASHWEAASKSHLEAEKQRREIADLRRELGQQRAYLDDLKKEMQLKASKMQEELNEAIAQKDASQEEVAAVKLAAERAERQARQEQARLQAEINSYKMRLERADADLVHARRENLRLGDEIAALEKEINMNKLMGETRVGGQPGNPKADRDIKDKELASLIFDLENRQAKTVASLEESLNKQASLVSRLTTECQSLTQRLEVNDQKHKKEMASLQDNIKLLSSKFKESLAGELDKTTSPSKQQELDSGNNVHCDSDLKAQSKAVELTDTGDATAEQPIAEHQDPNRQKFSEQPADNHGDDYTNKLNYSQYDECDPNQYPEYFSEQQFSENPQYDQGPQYLDEEPYNPTNHKDHVAQQDQ